MSENNSIQVEILDHFVRKSRIAYLCDVSQSSVAEWFSGEIPPARAIQIEELSHGKFKAVDIVKKWNNEGTGVRDDG